MHQLVTLGGLSIAGATPLSGEVRPRCLAVLAILAAAGPRGMSRERLMAILWPSRTPERARHSFSQALYALRVDLGTDVVVTHRQLRLDPGRITSDVEELHTAATAADWEHAAAVFVGPFLDGFYLAAAPEFERWVDGERASVAATALQCIERAGEALDIQDPARALAHWRRLAALDPLNARYAIACIERLVQRGERTGALACATAHAAMVRTEFDTEPDARVVELLHTLRAQATPETPPATVPRPATTRGSLPPWPRGSGARLVQRLSAGVAAGRSAFLVTLPSPRTLRRIAWTIVACVVALGAVATLTLRHRDEPMTPSDIGVRSTAGLRLYNDGLRAFYQGDFPAASQLFDAVLRQDSTFAMAAYFAWRAERATNGPREPQLATLASSLKARAPEPGRGLIRADLATARGDLGALAAAESLVTRHPGDPDVLIFAARLASQPARAVGLLERAISADSANTVDPSTPCRRCEAFGALVAWHEWADSITRAEEAITRWSAARPNDYQPWLARASLAVSQGRRSDATVTLHRAASLGAPRSALDATSLARAIRLDDGDSANALCASHLSTPIIADVVTWRGDCTTVLRNQGRHREALQLARDGRIPWMGSARTGLAPDPVQAALLDMEMGRAELAAAEFARLAAAPQNAAVMTEYSAVAAVAQIAANDTARARLLVDSVHLAGSRSMDPRDPELYHFVNGLLLAAAGQHEAAVRDYRAGLSHSGAPRPLFNLALATSLIALSREADAAVVLRAALRTPPGGSAAFVTRTELHEAMARAFAAEGQVDSASAHYGVVARMWVNADSAYASRRDAARLWLVRRGRGWR